MTDQDTDVGQDGPRGRSGRDVVRSIAAEHDAGRTTGRDSSTASADSVDALRRAVRDLKHDVRMLKVTVDKQTAIIQQLMDRLDA